MAKRNGQWANKTDTQKSTWWTAFCRRHRFTTRRIGSIKQINVASDNPLVQRFRKAISRAVRQGKYQFLVNGDETPIRVEDVSSGTANSVGAKRVRIRTSGHEKTCLTAFLMASVRVEMDNDDKPVITRVQRFKQGLFWPAVRNRWVAAELKKGMLQGLYGRLYCMLNRFWGSGRAVGAGSHGCMSA